MINATNLALTFAVLFGISEALALIPAVKANSVFESIKNVLGMLKVLVSGKSA